MPPQKRFERRRKMISVFIKIYAAAAKWFNKFQKLQNNYS